MALILIAAYGAAFAACPSADEHANAPVYKATYSGNTELEVAGLCWTGSQEGLTLGVRNLVHVPVINPAKSSIEKINNLIESDIIIPSQQWNFGSRLGLTHTSPHDGWRVGVDWTHFHPHSNTYLDAPIRTDIILIPLISAFTPVQGGITFTREIRARWREKFDMIDATLGRPYWISRHCYLHPVIGLRIARLDQELTIHYQAGSWSPRTKPNQPAFWGLVELENNFHGIGPLCGLGGGVHIGCGFGVYGKGALSLVCGRFKILHKEENYLPRYRNIRSPILSSGDYVKASRPFLDLSCGLSYHTRPADGNWSVEVKLGWEYHLFLHQNQLFCVKRLGDTLQQTAENNSGKNIFQQLRGNGTAQGCTLSFAVLF